MPCESWLQGVLGSNCGRIEGIQYRHRQGDLSDDQKKQVDDLQKTVDTKLDKILTDDQKQKAQKAFDESLDRVGKWLVEGTKEVDKPFPSGTVKAPMTKPIKPLRAAPSPSGFERESTGKAFTWGEGPFDLLTEFIHPRRRGGRYSPLLAFSCQKSRSRQRDRGCSAK